MVLPAGTISVDEFRSEAAAFIAASLELGVACPSFGAIMPPGLYDRAKAWQRHCFDQGFAGISWPVEHGGRGLSIEHGQAWSEECARAGVTAFMNFQGSVLAGPAIIEFGTPDQLEFYLEATLATDVVWCQLFSEPGAGSDLASLITRAEPDGDGWRVTGQKVWSSTAQLATHAILLARTNPDEANHRGISFFLFDMATPGVEVRPLTQMTGDQEFCEVFLDDAYVPAEGLLGPLHGGWTVTTSVLADERSGAAAAGIALNRKLAGLSRTDRAINLTVQGSALGHLLTRSGGDPMLGPLTKLALAEITSDLTNTAINELGVAGSLTNPLTNEFLYAPGMRLAGGTSEIQRNLIGERLLGLPREPKSPKKS